MASVNKVILVGNLGKDPEVRYTGNSIPVASFSLATTEYYKDKNGNRQEITEWHNIVAWRNLAELAEKYLKKGKQVYVEGKIRTRSWDDKDGNKKYTTEVIADNFILLGKKEGDSGQENNQSKAAVNTSEVAGIDQAPTPDQIPIDDDLPF